jgi:hypothetical protein
VATIVGFESLSIPGSSVSLTIPSGAHSFYGRVETADVRLRSDGTNATTGTGILVAANEFVLIGDEELNRHSFHAASGTTATLQGHYYAEPEGIIAGLQSGTL